MKFITLTFGFQNRKAFEQFKVDVGVSKQTGAFYFPVDQIPACIRDTAAKELEECFDYPKTVAGVEKYYVSEFSLISIYIERAISAFEEVLKDEGSERVIVYTFKLQGDLTPDLGGLDKGSLRYSDIDHYERRDAIGVLLDWDILKKNKVMGRTEYFYENGSSTDIKGRREMPWSEEREAWFRSMQAGLVAMLIKIHNFMQIDVQSLQVAIDTGKLPMMLTGATEKPLPKKKVKRG